MISNSSQKIIILLIEMFHVLLKLWKNLQLKNIFIAINYNVSGCIKDLYNQNVLYLSKYKINVEYNFKALKLKVENTFYRTLIKIAAH